MIRIKNEGKPAVFTEITDAETGAKVELIKRVEIVIDAAQKGTPEAVLTFLKPELDIVAEVR